MASEVVFHSEELQEFLSGLSKRVKDVESKKKEFLGVLGSEIFRDIMNHFSDQRGEKRPWKIWSDVYAEHMRRIGKGSNKILQDSGHLRGSVKPMQFRVMEDAVVWFNNAQTKSGFPYAAAHDKGGEKLPQRDFMWLSNSAMDRIETLTLDYVLKGK
jgi:phage gpG-like protein